MARSKKSEPPAAPQGYRAMGPAISPYPPPTPQGATTAAPAPAGPLDPPPAKHGPAGPPRTLYGLAHLRAVQNLSTAVPIDQVCEEAALELARLRAEQRPHRWTDSDTL